MDVLAPRARAVACVGFRAEHAVRAVEHPHFAFGAARPAAVGDARAEHGVEQLRARRRQQHRALLALDALAPANMRRAAATLSPARPKRCSPK
jgi:hypothetical protein